MGNPLWFLFPSFASFCRVFGTIVIGKGIPRAAQRAPPEIPKGIIFVPLGTGSKSPMLQFSCKWPFQAGMVPRPGDFFQGKISIGVHSGHGETAGRFEGKLLPAAPSPLASGVWQVEQNVSESIWAAQEEFRFRPPPSLENPS